MSPTTAADHVKSNFSKFDLESIVRLWIIMSTGGDGGPIEPWGPSIRDVVYPNWSDADFTTAITLVSENSV